MTSAFAIALPSGSVTMRTDRGANPNCGTTSCPARASASQFPFQNPSFPPPPRRRAEMPCPAMAAPRDRATGRARVELLACDLDGTLLDKSKRADARNTDAVLSAMRAGLIFVPATGKSRAGAVRAMGRLGEVLLREGQGDVSGVFLNGLLVFGGGGKLLYEQTLGEEAASEVLGKAERLGLTVLFYAGDRVMVRARTRETDMFIVSHEPVPEAVGDLAGVVRRVPVHKALLMDPGGEVVSFRKGLEKTLEGMAEITQARPDVLEVMPKGVSKGTGFVRLLEDFGVARKNSMAIGDGENDVEMLGEAGLGVAVANAVPQALKIADAVVCGHDDAAVAEAIRRFVTV